MIDTYEAALLGASGRVAEARDSLRRATEALIEYSGAGWPLTPVEVAAAQRRYDDALDNLVAAAMWHGQLYERRSRA